MSEFLPVVGIDSLVRDKNSGAILNCDLIEYESYKRKLNNSTQIKNKLQEQESKIEELRCDIAEIKDLLYHIINNK